MKKRPHVLKLLNGKKDLIPDIQMEGVQTLLIHQRYVENSQLLEVNSNS